MSHYDPDDMQHVIHLNAQTNLRDAVHFEISPREREDEQERDRHDDEVDPWGYPETVEPDAPVRIGDDS